MQCEVIRSFPGTSCFSFNIARVTSFSTDHCSFWYLKSLKHTKVPGGIAERLSVPDLHILIVIVLSLMSHFHKSHTSQFCCLLFILFWVIKRLFLALHSGITRGRNLVSYVILDQNWIRGVYVNFPTIVLSLQSPFLLLFYFDL